MGVSMVIWANQNLRAAVKAMQDTSARIYKDCSVINVEPKVGHKLDLLEFNAVKISV